MLGGVITNCVNDPLKSHRLTKNSGAKHRTLSFKWLVRGVEEAPTIV